MPELYDGSSLVSDLTALRLRPGMAPAVEVLEVFLDEVAQKEDALWQMCRRSADYSDPWFNCRAIETLLSRKYNIYRLRPLVPLISQFRVLYSFNARSDEFHLLAAVLKPPNPVPPGTPKWSFYDYESDHPVTQRVVGEYDFRRIPRIP